MNFTQFLDFQEVRESLTLDEVEAVVRSLGVEDVERHPRHLILPTICHNPLHHHPSKKLYYYDDNKIFHCYTDCGDSFDIFELFQRTMRVRGEKVHKGEALSYVSSFLQGLERIELPPMVEDDDYESGMFAPIKLKEYPKTILDCFSHIYPSAWRKEGITPRVMDNFGILFSYGQNKIIIPHYDADGRLVGVRGRAQEEKDIALGKYRPISFGGTTYSHRLGFNLYGIKEHKEAISRRKTAIIVEGEKSVLLDSVYFGDHATSVAVCGSSVNKFQIGQLLDLGVEEIVIAFDKEFPTLNSPEAREYRKKLKDLCLRYASLAKMSYIFDEHNLLQQKDSPYDRGKETFLQLYKQRITVTPKWNIN